MSAIRPFRALQSDDRSKRLGDMLQLLVAHGDEEFVIEIGKMIEYRIEWLLHRDNPDPPPER